MGPKSKKNTIIKEKSISSIISNNSRQRPKPLPPPSHEFSVSSSSPLTPLPPPPVPPPPPRIGSNIDDSDDDNDSCASAFELPQEKDNPNDEGEDGVEIRIENVTITRKTIERTKSGRSITRTASDNCHNNNNNNEREDPSSSSLRTGGSDGSNVSQYSAFVNKINKFRTICGKMVNNSNVQVFIILLIIINAIIMGVATFDFVTDVPKTERIFEIIDLTFLIIFTFELGLQIIYHGIRLFLDGWLVFDFVIIVMSWSFSSLQIIRAFRIFRALRLVTRVKQLRDLILALGEVLPRMYAIAALLMLVFYIFAVLFTELFKDLELSENYFKTLDASLLTCLELMTLGWEGIVREVMASYDWAWLPFIAFISITGFIVFNLIVAVVCDAIAVVERQNHEFDEQEQQQTDNLFEDNSSIVDNDNTTDESNCGTNDNIENNITNNGKDAIDNDDGSDNRELDIAQRRIDDLSEQVIKMKSTHAQIQSLLEALVISENDKVEFFKKKR